MKQRLSIAGLTVVVLGAGYGAGVWTERTRCKVPPPPPTLLGELSAKPAPTPAPAPSNGPNVTALAKQIEALRPQIEAFRAKRSEIDAEMDRRIDAILRPDQREAFKALIARGEKWRAREEAEKADSTPLTPAQIEEIQQRPLQYLLSVVVVPIRLHWNTKQLKLDETQRGQLADILKWRREKFLELIDESPPPSLTLSTLAVVAQRLVDPNHPEANQPTAAAPGASSTEPKK